MKKHQLLLFVLAALPLSMMAGKVTREQALKTAKGFMNGKTFMPAASYSRARGYSQKADEDPFYVFNATDGGYVIVSSDDRTREILGYSPTGTLDMDSLPANLQWWLDEYARQIDALGTSTVAVKPLKQSSVTAISPLIQTKWDQYGPYNYMCPDGNGRDYDESGYDNRDRCVTGCTATAMAQVMNYWKWPESCPALNAYSTKSFEVKGLPSTTFKWDLMKDSYNYSETGEAANAVAELMRYCGQAVHMDYGTSESSGGVSKEIMVETFNYSPSISSLWRNDYHLEAWENIIYLELAEGRPVLYRGGSDSSGHAFVVDGYSSNGLFHINWGWGGHLDNYFVLSVADPSQPGVDGGSSSGGYRYGQTALVGIKPFREGEIEPYAMLSNDSLTVTFYYDGHMPSRNGMAIGYYGKKPTYYTATTAVFDDSFADYYPYSTERWFYRWYNLKEIKGISNLNTDKVKKMESMFEGCSSLTSLDLSGFKTDNVTGMYGMFRGCSSLTSLDLSGFKTDNVTRMNYMFFNCRSLTSLDMSGFKTDNVTDMSAMFYDCSSLTNLDVSGFTTDNVTDMSGMFAGCSSLTSLDLSGFKTDNVTDMQGMFAICSGLTSLDLSGFKTDNVTNMENMFWDCSGLTSLDVSGFITDNVTDMGSIFSGCSSLTSLDLSGFKTDIVTNMNNMFNGCSGLTSLNVSGFKTDNVTNMNNMFNGCSGLTSLDLSSLNTYKVTDMSYMFNDCRSLTNLDLSGFKTDNVTDMSYMFYNCSSLTNLDVSGFKTNNVTNMRGMFYGCSSLTTIYAGDGWSTEKVTSGGSMFWNCTSLVGGKGTVYDIYHTDYTYARIDGGETDPGYFTAKEPNSFTLGDINGDREVDVSDYIGIANHILGNTPAGFNEKAADVNEDGVIDVSDYIGVANIILTGSVYGSRQVSRISRHGDIE